MKNQKTNNLKNTEKEDNSKNKLTEKDKTIITKNAKYVLVAKNNEVKKKTEAKKKTSVLSERNDSLISKSNKFLKNIKLPKFLLKYKAHSINAICLSLVSVLLLSGFSLFDSLSSTPSLSSYYSAKSYTLFIDDKEIGTVRERETVDIAIKKLESEYRNKNNTESVVASSVRLVESNANDSELISDVKLNSSLRSKLDIKSQGYALSVNGEVIGVLKSKEEANDLINSVKDYFTAKYEQDQIISAEFSENISIDAVTVAHDKIDDKDELLEYILIGTDEKVSYTVQKGDTYWDIAIKNKMTVEDLMAANPSAKEDKLMPGDELSLVVPKPFINVNIERKLIVEEKIKYGTETQKVSYMYSDEKKVKKAGVYGKDDVEYIITEQNGIEISRKEVSRTNKSQPQNEIVLVGTQDPPPKVGSGTFIKPLASYTISSAYGSRSGGFHRGLDMATKSGTDIKAADGGTVTYSGWYGQYGYMVEISHGGGWSTVYAHCSKLYVKTGDKVYQGQVIAAVGSTGQSTGPHLHFEVRKYKATQNPASYLGKQYK